MENMISDERKVECNISPFNSQYNAMMLERARMQREGATPEQLRDFSKNYRITTTEGQWKVPQRLPTQEEHYKISAELLGRKQ